MAAFIHLVNDISTPVKLGWAIVLVWSVVQVMWYRRGRSVSAQTEPVSDTDPARGGWSIARLVAMVTRSSEAGESDGIARSPLSIAPARLHTFEDETGAESRLANDGESVDTDWFDEALRMSETARARPTDNPTNRPGVFGLDQREEARQ